MSEPHLPHDHSDGAMLRLQESVETAGSFQTVADIFKLLSDSSRVRIFWLLCHCEECVIDLSAMVAGTKYRGEFEERIRKVIREVTDDGNILLFLDELHTLIGAGGAEGAIDASNILKPSLARGEIQLIGATTLEEYRKYIEKDAALERRFQPVTVEEPTEDECIRILEGLKEKYEAHHDVEIEEDALKAAVHMLSLIHI